MKILIAGASGFVGKALVSFLEHRLHNVYHLVRREPQEPKEIFWDPTLQKLLPEDIIDIDAVINLSGEPIAEGRWTVAKKRKILESRVQSTTLLVETIAKLKNKPKVLINASAVGYYGDTGDSWVSENSPPGTDFLATVCQKWEKAADPVEALGVRLVKLRFGMVLSDTGGALKKMLLPFKLGLGGVIGSGDQYISWILLDDLLSIIDEALKNPEYKGVINTVTNQPVTNREFTKILGQVLQRPTVLSMPAFAARLVFGEVADALLLSSSRVKPQKLEELGYKFLFPQLKEALSYHLTTEWGTQK